MARPVVEGCGGVRPTGALDSRRAGRRAWLHRPAARRWRQGDPPDSGRSPSSIPFAVLSLIAALCACSSDASPSLIDAGGRDLGPSDFVRDGGDLGDAGLADVADVADTDVATDVPTGIGDPCQLLAQGDCADGLKCVLRFDGTGECRRLAEPPVALGEPCGRRGIDDCGQGQLCVSVDEAGGLRCRVVCNAATGAGCADDTSCSEQLPLVEDPVGVCI